MILKENIIISQHNKYAAGKILLTYKAENKEVVLSLLKSFNLEVNNEFVNSPIMVIRTPILFEAQWVEALSNENVIKTAELDGIVEMHQTMIDKPEV